MVIDVPLVVLHFFSCSEMIAEYLTHD